MVILVVMSHRGRYCGSWERKPKLCTCREHLLAHRLQERCVCLLQMPSHMDARQL